MVDAAAFSTDGDPGSAGFRHNFARSRIEGGPNATCGSAPVSFPQNATLTDVTAHVADNTSGPGFDVAVKLWRDPRGVADAEEVFSKSTSLFPWDITLTGTMITTPLVDNFTYGYFVTVCGLRETNYLYGVAISYTPRLIHASPVSEIRPWRTNQSSRAGSSKAGIRLGR